MRHAVLVQTGYRAIADEIRGRIRTGALKPGERLPGVRAIAATYGVTQGTAAAALRTLATEGYVTVEPSVGASVAATLPAEAVSLEERVTRLEQRLDRHEHGHTK